jgi:hypothetical protein
MRLRRRGRRGSDEWSEDLKNFNCWLLDTGSGDGGGLLKLEFAILRRHAILEGAAIIGRARRVIDYSRHARQARTIIEYSRSAR